MGLYQFRLPDVGEGVAEAEVTVWHVKPGDVVKEDQSLVDVMTDKATVDMTSPVDGVVTAIHGVVGAMMPVGSVLVELEVTPEAATEPTPVAVSEPLATTVAASASAPSSGFVPRAPSADLMPAAAPSTRRRAKQAGIDLRDVPGSGSGGRITSHDLDAILAQRQAPPSSVAPRTDVHETRIIGLRRKIAEKMQEAKRRIPHIAYVEEVDVTELEALRQDLNAHKAAEQPKLTLLPFLIRALVRALPDFPQINARYDDDAGILHGYEAVHIGIATRTPGGLIVPVIRHAETRDLWALAAELQRLGQAARDGSAKREELSGSTITITSLGSLGGIASAPVINHPEVAIIGPNKIVERPVVDGSFVTVRKMMNLSSSFDHRIVDGYDAAMFVQRLKRLIEHPALIFMD
ncbi:dihydrolipoamide acetyltransferase family protein [Sphingomonas oryzagri]|jgi:2-oxoisovalerate dehydrogenase E2 component (dihydrolipoyl transacylase)|uniref:Dihydrolipoamide acetyltransferase component of pyruvate dehydrogenase complex n=1 Tax=Sphingomonas oryzagri TaxID=3042314 RepID=A0ABT6MXS3_9SPHN|nr:dihydrolipoamide acetyltransferase family protein [Sphingomonas oryzagri]MDH7637637.1 dihydrolipoamide acetyltransferase family protein [Sphingomonas oryzagri]